MSAQQHTPGPWRTHAVTPALVEQDEPLGLFVADCRMTDEGAANARLISAAPEMRSDGAFLLDRLDEFEREIQNDDLAREWDGHVGPAIARFRAAIAKAEGRS